MFMCCFFFFKQKTAYEMRISDWSSDVCSSDLWMGALTDNLEVLTHTQEGGSWGRAATNDLLASRIKIRAMNFMRGRTFLSRWLKIGRASCRERVCQYVYISVVAG